MPSSRRTSHSRTKSEQDKGCVDRTFDAASLSLPPKRQSTTLPLPELQDVESTAHRSLTTSSPRGASHLKNARGPSVSSALPFGLRKYSPRLQQLIDKRLSLIGIRLRTRERRYSLRNERETLGDSDAQFSQEFRNIAAISTHPRLKALLTQYEEKQVHREELQLKETEYNLLEDELNRTEWEVREDESKFYRRLSRADHHFHGGDVDSFSGRSFESVASSSSTESLASIFSPNRQRWLSKIGDKSLLMEQLEDLRGERAYWVEEENTRRKVGLGLPEEGQLFLATFDTRHESFLDDLAQVEVDLARLQDGLLEQADLMYPSSQFDDKIPTPDSSSLESKLEMMDTDDRNNATDDPLFLRQDDSKSFPVFSNLALDPKEDSISTISYINAWLLHILRRSAIEVRRFKTNEILRTLQLNREQVAQLVLEWWSKDVTVKMFPTARNYSARSVSIASIAQDGLSTNIATRSDSVLFNVARIAHRLQGTQTIRLDEAPSMTLSRRPKILQRPYHQTAASF